MPVEPKIKLKIYLAVLWLEYFVQVDFGPVGFEQAGFGQVDFAVLWWLAYCQKDHYLLADWWQWWFEQVFGCQRDCQQVDLWLVVGQWCLMEGLMQFDLADCPLRVDCLTVHSKYLAAML